MLKRVAILAVFLLFLAVGVAAAKDTVYLKTGAIYTGRIVKVTDDGVTIDVDGLGRLFVAKRHIDRIEGEGYDDPPPPPPEPAPEPEPGPSPAPPPEPAPQPEPGPAPAPEPETPSEPAPQPEPAPAGETPPEPAPHPDAAPAAEATPAPSGPQVPWSEMRPGEPWLLVLAGEDHGDWRESGRRIIAEVPVVGEARFKAVVAPEKGVLGTSWLARKDVRRAVRLDDRSDRLLLLLEGIETGSWLVGEKKDGTSFEGRLSGLTPDGKVILDLPRGDAIENHVEPLGEIRSLSAVIRAESLRERIEGLVPGEPVALEIRGRKEPVRGRVMNVDDDFLRLETPTDDGGYEEVSLFRGRPVTALHTLSEAVRAGFAGLAREDFAAANTFRTEGDRTIRRTIVGTFVDADLETIRIRPPDGEVSIPVAELRSIEKVTEDAAAAHHATKQVSDADSVLPVLPGMSRGETERRLPGRTDGIDVLFGDDDTVVRVFCRPPFRGPVFGIRVGDPFLKSLKVTDLVFDTQVDERLADGSLQTTMVSETLANYRVRVYVSAAGDALAIELSPRD